VISFWVAPPSEVAALAISCALRIADLIPLIPAEFAEDHAREIPYPATNAASAHTTVRGK
jgi:hypothetical protein